MKHIWLILRFFSEEQYADDFLNGKLYMNRLSYFQKQEEECTDGRADSTEAIKMWFQPHDISLSLNIPGIGSAKIGPADLAGPMSFTSGTASYLHVLCMYAIYTSKIPAVNQADEQRLKLIDELKRKFTIDQRCFKLGPFAVIVPAHPFLNQMQRQLRSQKYRFNAKLVEYYDDKTFHGEIPDSEVPFRKQVRFAYQSEYRLVVDPTLLADNPISIGIGPVHGIGARKVKSTDINTMLGSAVID